MINYGPPEQFMDIHELLWISIIIIMEIHDYEFGFPLTVSINRIMDLHKSDYGDT